MKEKFAKLIDVKTIVTFAIVGAMIYLAVTGVLAADKLFELGIMIVTFYFVKKADEAKQA